MIQTFRRGLLASVALLALTDISSSLQAQPPFRRIDSTQVKETGGIFIGKIGTIAIGPRGRLFVTDTDGRVIQIAPNGTIEKTFGRKGRGPGELETPDALAFFGDSLMLVADNGQQRIVVFDLRTGKYSRGFPLSMSRPTLTNFPC